REHSSTVMGRSSRQISSPFRQVAHSPRLLMLTQMGGCGIATEAAIDGRSCEMKILTKTDPKSWRRKGCAIDRKNF
ncbi:MAG: hypothetical protein WB696_30955, partial [Chthoniobacterales bacterium]